MAGLDVRQRRTRDRLFAGVLDLAATVPPDDISVTQLATAAGVHRSTLYEHTSSPVALLREALLTELDALRETLLAESEGDVVRAVTEVTRGALAHVLRHAPIYRRGLSDYSGTASLHSMLSGHFRASSRLLLQLGRVHIEVEVAGAEPDVVADQAMRFLAEGTVGLIAGWLEGPRPDITAFMDLYARLLPGWWPQDLTVSRIT